VLEESFVGVDARTALSVGQARGAVIVAAASPASRALSIAPADVKQAVLRLRPGREGTGAADGDGDPRPASATDAAPRSRRARGGESATRLRRRC
jgi:hypothetical protein